jgi:hypothetical protein
MENKNFAYLLILGGAVMFLLSLVMLRSENPTGPTSMGEPSSGMVVVD